MQTKQHKEAFVSVVIPVYEDPERLKTCLRALERQSYPDDRYEIIVVDNGPEGSIEPSISKSASIRFVRENKRGSYAARNKGIAVSRGEILAFTDADCIPSTDWIEKGVSHVSFEHNCGLVAGNIEVFPRDPDNSTICEHYDRLFGFQQEYWITTEGFGATGNLFTSKDVLDKVGIFDPAIKSLGDVEWCRRVASSGYNLYYGHDVCVRHPARHSLTQLFRKNVRIAGGSYQIDEKRMSRVAVIEKLRYSLVPSMKGIKNSFGVVFSDSHLRGTSQKLQVLLIRMFLRYSRRWITLLLSTRNRIRDLRCWKNREPKFHTLHKKR